MLHVCFVLFRKLMFSHCAFFRNKALMFHRAIRPDWSVKPNMWIGVSPSFDQFSYYVYLQYFPCHVPVICGSCYVYQSQLIHHSAIDS